jgi:hypothetical protein
MAILLWKCRVFVNHHMLDKPNFQTNPEKCSISTSRWSTKKCWSSMLSQSHLIDHGLEGGIAHLCQDGLQSLPIFVPQRLSWMFMDFVLFDH